MDWLVGVADPVFMLSYDIAMGIAMIADTIITISSQISFREQIKKLPYEKAKKIMTEKFIQIGGAVLKRHERFNELFANMKFNIDEEDDDEEIIDEFSDTNTDENTNEV